MTTVAEFAGRYDLQPRVAPHGSKWTGTVGSHMILPSGVWDHLVLNDECTKSAWVESSMWVIIYHDGPKVSVRCYTKESMFKGALERLRSAADAVKSGYQ